MASCEHRIILGYPSQRVYVNVTMEVKYNKSTTTRCTIVFYFAVIKSGLGQLQLLKGSVSTLRETERQAEKEVGR